MKMYAESGDCAFTFPDVATPAEYSGHRETMQKLARMKTVIDNFAIRVFDFKKRSCTDILEEVSGLHSPLRSIIAGAPLLRVQVNIILVNGIKLTMKVGRSILLQYYGLTEKMHSHVFRELENICSYCWNDFLLLCRKSSHKMCIAIPTMRLTRQVRISSLLTISLQ